MSRTTHHIVDGIRVPAEPEGLPRVKVGRGGGGGGGPLLRRPERPQQHRLVLGGGRQLPRPLRATRRRTRGEGHRGHAVVEAAETVQQRGVHLRREGGERERRKVCLLFFGQMYFFPNSSALLTEWKGSEKWGNFFSK